MFSVNQIAVYHTLLEAYNVVKHSTSEQIKKKWTKNNESERILRNDSNNSQKVPVKPMKNRQGFTYIGLWHCHPITLDPAWANTQPLMLCLHCVYVMFTTSFSCSVNKASW